MYFLMIDYQQILMDFSKDLGVKLLKTITTIMICAIALAILRTIRKRTQNSTATTVKEKRTETYRALLYSILRYSIYFLGVMQVCHSFDLDLSVLLTFAGVGSIAIGFGAQSLIQDCITGMFLLMEGQFGIGDLITIDNYTGTVETIGIRTTRIRSFDGNMHIIPNSAIKAVTNMTKGFKRALINVKFSYEIPIEALLSVLQDEMNQMPVDPEILYQTPNVVGVIDMNETSITIRIAAECKVGENWAIEREMRKRIARRIQEEKMAKPYPHYNVIMHSDKEDFLD